MSGGWTEDRGKTWKLAECRHKTDWRRRSPGWGVSGERSGLAPGRWGERGGKVDSPVLGKAPRRMVLPPPAAESTEGREDWREKRLEKAEQAESPKLGHLQALVQRAGGSGWRERLRRGWESLGPVSRP